MPPAGPRSGDAIFASVERVVSFTNSSLYVVFFDVLFVRDFKNMGGREGGREEVRNLIGCIQNGKFVFDLDVCF